MKSIQSMHILKGCNRSGNSLGIWTPYADGTVDMLPLGAIEDHQVFKSEAEIDEEINETEDVDNLKLQRLKKIANLRFKGSLTGNKQSSNEEPNHRQQQQQPEQDSNLDQTERKDKPTIQSLILLLQFNTPNLFLKKLQLLELKKYR